MKFKEWKIEYNIPDIPSCLSDAGYMPLLSHILALRGYNTPVEADKMLSASTDLIEDPMLIKDMDKAVNRINCAISSHEKIAVYGDYDVDGITSTCLLTDYLLSKGLSVTPYIPDRSEEGYGLNASALSSFAEDGITLVITVDCGITAVEESVFAKQLGIDMIITDHHECKSDEIPSVSAVVDCKQPSDTYPNKSLAGVGMAFKLVCAVEGNSLSMLDKYCDFVAIGTVADVMPLIDENRCFVAKGLEKIRKHPRPGIKALLDDAGVDPSNLNASSIGFSLSPRLNAAGRLNRAITAFDLLMCNDEDAAKSLAKELSDLNKERQNIEISIWKQAAEQVGLEPPSGPIVLASRTWHQGVIGIAASRLAEQYNVPTVMIYLNGDIGKGSCRSYGGFNLYNALNACSDSLISFGGHTLAAGLNIHKDNIDEFREKLRQYYFDNKPETIPEVNCELLIYDPSLLSIDNVKSLELLEPFGNANPKPVMCITGATLQSLSEIGNGKHLKMIIDFCGEKFPCIFFSHTLKDVCVNEGDIIDIAFTPQVNEFRGNVNVQLVVSDVRKHDGSVLCENILNKNDRCLKAARHFCPERSDFVRVWKSFNAESALSNSIVEILSNTPDGLVPEVYCLCLEVFSEAGLISSSLGGHVINISGKADLESTELMRKLRQIL